MLTLNDNGALLHLSGILARMIDMQPVMAAIGQHEAQEIEDRIMSGKHDPDGHAWSPWRPMRADEREAKGNAGQGLLWDEGTLLHSIMSRPETNGVSIGTDTPYANELQDGRRNMMARPFIGWSPAGMVHAEHAVVTYLEGINK